MSTPTSTYESLLALLREARRDWIRDTEWVGDQYGGVEQPTGEALRAFGARIDAALAARDTTDEWRPIETAPAGVRVLTARKMRDATEWIIDAATLETHQVSTGWHLGGGFFGMGVKFWKPMPSPPKTPGAPS